MYQYIRVKINNDVLASKQRETTHVPVHILHPNKERQHMNQDIRLTINSDVFASKQTKRDNTYTSTLGYKSTVMS